MLCNEPVKAIFWSFMPSCRYCSDNLTILDTNQTNLRHIDLICIQNTRFTVCTFITQAYSNFRTPLEYISKFWPYFSRPTKCMCLFNIWINLYLRVKPPPLVHRVQGVIRPKGKGLLFIIVYNKDLNTVEWKWRYFNWSLEIRIKPFPRRDMCHIGVLLC